MLKQRNFSQPVDGGALVARGFALPVRGIDDLKGRRTFEHEAMRRASEIELRIVIRREVWIQPRMR